MGSYRPFCAAKKENGEAFERTEEKEGKRLTSMEEKNGVSDSH